MAVNASDGEYTAGSHELQGTFEQMILYPGDAPESAEEIFGGAAAHVPEETVGGTAAQAPEEPSTEAAARAPERRHLPQRILPQEAEEKQKKTVTLSGQITMPPYSVQYLKMIFQNKGTQKGAELRSFFLFHRGSSARRTVREKAPGKTPPHRDLSFISKPHHRRLMSHGRYQLLLQIRRPESEARRVDTRMAGEVFLFQHILVDQQADSTLPVVHQPHHAQ